MNRMMNRTAANALADADLILFVSDATRWTEEDDDVLQRLKTAKAPVIALLNKIDKALVRIDEGDYGFCEETGEEIGLARLEARPIATLCLDAQERWELRQKQMGDSR